MKDLEEYREILLFWNPHPENRWIWLDGVQKAAVILLGKIPRVSTTNENRRSLEGRKRFLVSSSKARTICFTLPTATRASRVTRV